MIAGGTRASDFPTCRYGTSPLSFRGPRRQLGGEYLSCIGGTETYGRYVAQPFPDILEQDMDLRCVNFGYVNAGIDVFLGDATVIETCAHSAVTVIQVLGAHNLTNRFYTVHPRRNDRFVKASAMLRALYPEIDFTHFHFTRHMLDCLIETSPSRFELVLSELQRLWIAKMRLLTDRVGRKAVLVWIADRGPGGSESTVWGGAPLFVTRAMLDAVEGRLIGLVEVVETPQERAAALGDKVFGPGEQQVALQVPGPRTHMRAADAIADAIRARRAASGECHRRIG
ncbi:hypothetical protein PMES_02191 [Profundibacterium mesophilum KAUST100406-0324]|uniref:DUF6473 domain-containing protein n=2 Tax=Profundibacterium TaxID=1258570 RepID=A0A921NQH9_9RHOB|nr:hypothetical protein PMES_02191 [Profundibacterium mesophilum KAUST100406-0324]